MIVTATLSSFYRKTQLHRSLVFASTCPKWAPSLLWRRNCGVYLRRNPLHIPSLISRPYTNKSGERSTPSNIAIREIQKENEKMVKLIWSDDSESFYPYAFLQENCKCSKCFEPSSKQRTVDVLKDGVLNCEYKEAVISETGENLKCVWANDHHSVYSAGWLYNRQLVKTEEKSRDIVHDNVVLWANKEMQDQIPCYDYEAFMQDDKNLFDALYSLYQRGLMLVDNGPTKEGTWKDFAKRIGYQRPTHYGKSFDVKNKSDPSNVAYTNDFIPFHVDLLYLSRPPCVQMLHCVQQAGDGMGGESLFVDGFNVAKKLKEIYYSAFEMLATVNVSFQDFGADAFGQFSVGSSRPTIELNEHGRMTGIMINNVTRADRFKHLTPQEILEFYDALYLFNKMMYEPGNVVKHRLKEGQTIFFQNTRVLHSRTAIDPAASRLLQGNYYEWDVIFSKLRCLHAKLSSETPDLYGESNDFF